MAAALFGKRDSDDVDGAETSHGDHPSELEQLTGQLGRLGELLAQAKEQIAVYLVRRESRAPAGDAGDETTGALGRQIAELAEKVDKLAAASSLAGAPTASPAESGTAEQGPPAALQPLQEQLDRLEASLKRLSEASGAAAGGDGVTNTAILEAVRQLQVRFDGGLRQLTDLLAPPEEAADDTAAPPTSAQWEQAVVGPALAANPALALERRQLLGGVLEGQAGACALAGQLLVFQSAPVERLPQLLKDIGEAFYRWQPKMAPGTNPMEQTLADWLQRSCETAGIYNTIELVHPGERFDSTRHTATSRGVEITEVRGWIVLRDNGRVYTKATVEVR
ncbi:MAG TPA: hypothetical protein VMY37_07580 [Thermoguttaceae bacterium]|nr:hypothetical protein [Thermoguttaceae bacterium]